MAPTLTKPNLDTTRYWGMNIVIDGSTIKDEFEDPLPVMGDPLKVINERPASISEAIGFAIGTQNIIRSMTTSPVGRLLVQLINSENLKITIRPLTSSAYDLTSSVANEPEAARRNNQGSNVTIWFDPDTWGGSAAQSAFDPANHYRPDDVLFHEFVHALRMLRGLWNPTMIPDWDNIEDLIAIMMTNIYVSTGNRNQDLRGDHSLRFNTLGQAGFIGKMDISMEDKTSDRFFYNMYVTEIDDVCQRMTDLCQPISLVPCRWNPLRARHIDYQNKIFPRYGKEF